ncbi:sensor histidine kinase [Candidatus Woesearchaeota archaeon]|nr:sensor histidine kinase [Candidatus Woesearchaeota archaeon]
MKRLREFLFGSISRKITFSFILIVLVMALGYVSDSFIVNKSLKDEVFSHLKTASQSRAHHIKTYMGKSIESLDLITSRTALRESLKEYNERPNNSSLARIRKILSDAMQPIEEFERVCIISREGIIIASTEESFIGKDVHEQDFFISAAKIGPEKILSGEEEGAVIHFTEEENKSKIFFVGPLVLSREIIGFVITVVSSDYLNSILADPTGLGETGEIYLVNRKRYMATPSRLAGSSTHSKKIDTYQVNLCFSEHLKLGLPKEMKEKPIAYLNYAGTMVLGVHYYMRELGWCMISEISEKEAIGFQRSRLLVSSLITLFLSLVLVIFIGFYFFRSLTLPIRQLSGLTAKMEQGNFDSKADIRTGDELEFLGNAFNRTMEILKQRDIEHKQLDRAKTEFLSITSHELRSPMTPMRAQLQMIGSGYYGKLNKRQMESVQIVLRNTERLDKIIQDFLEVSRIEAARLKFSFVKEDITPYVYKVIEEMKGFMPEKNVRIISSIGKLPLIESDPDRVMQVLRNLINNAIKFSSDDCKVYVSVEAKKGHILFTVKDTGIGIRLDEQKRVFEPFYQAGGMYYRKYGGTGLGLAICRGIIESQEGRIWMESEYGKGSAFYFTVPFVPVKEIRPIRLLFTPRLVMEDKAKKAMVDFLGPMGEVEFQAMKKGRMTYENIRDYLRSLVKEKVISLAVSKELTKRLVSVYGIRPTANKRSADSGSGRKMIEDKNKIRRSVKKEGSK